MKLSPIVIAGLLVSLGLTVFGWTCIQVYQYQVHQLPGVVPPEVAEKLAQGLVSFCVAASILALATGIHIGQRAAGSRYKMLGRVLSVTLIVLGLVTPFFAWRAGEIISTQGKMWASLIGI
ncbi:MAG: hypothetical protein JW937_00030 [Candidatus Omnitrophica bacterium]|nr:hypothetical protein [Candidatus Omnitrophota bacterium]